MPEFAALLRGINVGRAKRVAMADLRDLLTGLGYTDVRTHLQSGNAVFNSPGASPGQLESEVEKAIADRLGMDVRCLVRTGAQMRAVVQGHPLAEVATDGARMMALFLSAPPNPALLAEHDPVALSPHEVRLGDQVIYQWCPNGILESPPVNTYVEKHLKVSVTARNWNTVTKLDSLLND